MEEEQGRRIEKGRKGKERMEGKMETKLFVKGEGNGEKRSIKICTGTNSL